MNQPKQFIVEGVDRMGKSTLIANLVNELGYHLVIHHAKPKKLKAYEEITNDPLKLYQHNLYRDMFNMLSSGHHLIYDRGHLGEIVYAARYRGYSGDYVLDFEHQANTSETRLILLTTSDFSFITDDGHSFDFNRKEEEQATFLEAFNKSSIKDKVLIDVSNGKGGYKSPEQILNEVLKK